MKTKIITAKVSGNEVHAIFREAIAPGAKVELASGPRDRWHSAGAGVWDGSAIESNVDWDDAAYAAINEAISAAQ